MAIYKLEDDNSRSAERKRRWRKTHGVYGPRQVTISWFSSGPRKHHRHQANSHEIGQEPIRA